MMSDIQSVITSVREHLQDGDPLQADSELSDLTVTLRSANAPVGIIKLAEKALDEVQMGTVENAETYLELLADEAQKNVTP